MARILVIDDEVDMRDVLRGALEAHGHEVIVAADGAQGLDLQRKHPADLVITDIFMPGREGIETIRDLKQEFPGLKILVMSGGGRSRQKVEAVSLAAGELGADRFLHKPFDSSTLLRAVEDALRQPAGQI